MTIPFLDQFIDIAKEHYPNEAGIMANDNEFELLVNESPSPEDSLKFRFNITKDWSWFIHSHPEMPPYPSLVDMKTHASTGWNMGIVSVYKSGRIETVEMSDEIPNLESRPYIYGVNDCYSLVRDYHRMHSNITLPVYPRRWAWWASGEHMYRENIVRHCTRVIGEPAVGDIFLARILSKVENHSGILTSKHYILHHMGSDEPYDTNKLSKIEPLKRYKRHITSWWRVNAEQ